MQGGQTGPRSFGQVMDAAFSIYTRQFVPLAKIAAAVWIPLILALVAIDLYRFAEVAGGDLYIVGEAIRPLEESRILTGSILLAVLYVFGFLLVVGASLRAASQAYLGQTPEVGPSIRFAAGRFGHMFWLLILLVLFLGLASFAFLVPAIYLSIVWILAMPALLLEKRGGFKALGRSNGLIKDFWWRTFGIVIVIAIFTTIVGAVIPGLIASVLDGLSDDNFTLWILLTDIVTGLGFIFTAPIWASAITVMYYDMRVRKEGFDVEMMVGRLDEPGRMGPETTGTSLPPSVPPPGASPPPPPPPAA